MISARQSHGWLVCGPELTFMPLIVLVRPHFSLLIRPQRLSQANCILATAILIRRPILLLATIECVVSVFSTPWASMIMVYLRNVLSKKRLNARLPRWAVMRLLQYAWN